jgi:DUF4097 and DUF4098 domain-containing protein YvlB
MMRRPIIVLGSLVAIATIAYGGLTAISFMSHHKARTDLSLPGDVTTIALNLDSGDVVLIGDSPGKITGVRTVESGLTRPKFSEIRTGNTLKLSGSCPNTILPALNCNVRYELHVPPNVTVSGSNSGGNIRTESTGGPVNVDSSGGDVTVVDPIGDVDARSSGGNVTVLRARGGTVTADSSGGNVTVTFIGSPTKVNVSSSAGNVTVRLPHDDTSYNVDASSSGGSSNVEVRTDPASTKHIKADSSGGDVTITYATPA